MAEALDRTGWRRNGEGTDAGPAPSDSLIDSIVALAGQSTVATIGGRMVATCHYKEADRTYVWLLGNEMDEGGAHKKLYWALSFLIAGKTTIRLDDAVIAICEGPSCLGVYLGHQCANRLSHKHIAVPWGGYFLREQRLYLTVQSYLPYCLRTANPSRKRLLKVLHGVAKGLRYLHSKRLLHRDLRPGNVCFDDLGVPKLMDWDTAFSIPVGHESIGQSQLSGHIRHFTYCAPEMIEGGRVGFPVDIWAFAVTVVAMLNKLDPAKPDVLVQFFEDAIPSEDSDDGLLQLAANLRTQPRVVRYPRDVPDSLQTLVDQCLDTDQKGRPTASQIVEQFSEIRRDSEALADAGDRDA